MIKKIMAAILLSALPTLGIAAGEHVHLDRAPINTSDTASLQRGAALFINYCLNCHSANYMRYNRLKDIEIGRAHV